MRNFLDRFRRDIAAVAWSAGALFLGLALISYNSTDPSFNSASTFSSIQNYCGIFGSFMADILLQTLGISSWILVISLARQAYKAFKGESLAPKRQGIFLMMMLVLNTAALLGLYFTNTKIHGGAITLGGGLGEATAEGLLRVFNFVGVSIILWTTSLLFLIYFTQKTLSELFGVPLKRSQDLLKKVLSQLITKPAQVALASPTNTASAGTQSESKKTFFPINIKKSFSQEDQKSPVAEVSASVADASDLERDQNESADEKDVSPSLLQKIVFKAKTQSETELEAKRKESVLKKVQRRIENWELPKVTMLAAPGANSFKVDQKLIARNTQLLEDKLAQFSVNGQVTAVRPGPAVTLFEFKPNADVKISRITDLADDLSLAMSAESVRIIAPLPGRDVVGIETSNPKRETVFLREVLEDSNFWDEKVKLPIALGKQANGDTKVVDLRKMPHMMVAGTTGSGKSVFVVSMITALLFKHSPKTLRLILVDPKQVDLAVFNDIPHLLMPPIREPKKAVVALKWAIKEMEKRYRSMSKFGVRQIEPFNETVAALSKDKFEMYEKELQEIEETRPHESFYITPQPYLVIIVEEFADLMSVDKQNVEQAVVRIAQMARACGIHLVLAMQSPRKDVVTGLIKTNIPGRASFKVASKMDSRIILDESGAERLLANGDMLYQAPGVSKPERHHGPWLPEAEIAAVARFWSDQAEPEFDRHAMKMLEGSGGGFDLPGTEGEDGGDSEYDEMYDEILAYVAGQKEISASLLQRKFRFGYPRAARLIEVFEKEGVVGPANGSKPRQVLVNKL